MHTLLAFVLALAGCTTVVSPAPEGLDYNDWRGILKPYPDVSSTDLAEPVDMTDMASTDLAGGRVLRVLPIGDSITFGPSVSNPTDNTYRGPLWDLLAQAGYQVDFVGSRSSGDAALPDHDNEGRPGWSTLDYGTILNSGYNRRSNWSVAVAAQAPVDAILALIGTNDCFAGGSMIGGWEPESVPERLLMLVYQAYVQAPSAVILLATIPPIPDQYYHLAHLCVVNANAQLPAVMTYLRARGVNVRLVDHGLTNADVCPVAAGGTPGTTGGDCIHPNSGGRLKLALAWTAAFQQWVGP